MLTIREFGERGIVLRSLREGIDTSNATGGMVAGVLASLAELEYQSGGQRYSMNQKPRWAEGCTRRGKECFGTARIAGP
jgi:DNA invertase Pin-like site-specific DNA recombinase